MALTSDCLTRSNCFCILFDFLFLSYSFNIGLVHCARIYFQGGEPKFSDGIKFSATRIPVIFSWSILAATVGLIIKAIQENSGSIGAIVSGLIGMVWSVATFFFVLFISLGNRRR